MSEFSKQTSATASAKGTADLYFQVRGLPVAKPRQSRRDSFQPSSAVQRYRAWADVVRLAARQAYMGPGLVEPAAGAIAMSAIFFLPIPRSWPKTRQLAAMAIKPTVQHTSKPDLDNLIKGLKDPLTGLVWVDDAQVIEYRTPMEKGYGHPESVGAHCWIWFLEGADDAQG